MKYILAFYCAEGVCEEKIKSVDVTEAISSAENRLKILREDDNSIFQAKLFSPSGVVIRYW